MTVPLIVFALFLGANLGAVMVLWIVKSRGRCSYLRSQKIRGALADAVFFRDTGKLNGLVQRYPEESLRLWRDLRSALTFNSAEEEPIRKVYRSSGIEKRMIRMLHSVRRIKRYQAAQMIRPLVSPENSTQITRALLRESQEYIRLVLVKDLIIGAEHLGFDGIAESLESCSMEYFRSVRSMLASTNPRFIGWARKRLDRKEPGYMIAILSGAQAHTTSWLKTYTSRALTHDDPRVRSTAIETAEAVYPDLLVDTIGRSDADIITGRAAVRSIARITYPLDIDFFSEFFTDPTVQDVAVSALIEYISRHPEECGRFLKKLETSDNPDIHQGLSLSLAGRLPFLLTASDEPERAFPIVKQVILSGKSTALIAFLNTNRDTALKNLIFNWIRPFLVSDSVFRHQCATYLNPELREELGITPEEVPKGERKIPLTRADRIGLFTLLFLIIGAPVAAIMYDLSGATIGRVIIVAREVFRLFTYGFAFYAVVLNCIYLLLILLAVRNLNRQAEYWKLIDKEYLFTPGILPSISILVPAYNEVKTVIQSVYSLLTLEYPDYQVIVINDGSSDKTFDVLKEEFELKRVDLTLTGNIPTAPIRGIYRSPKNAKLLVIDKENGGKADALNTGINFANREYICSIDSDSLLEPDALLRMTAQILTSDTETIAVGGNILPVNGCTVERGMLQRIALSKNRIARLQTIEYLRSFIAGRLGWSQLNALLIISGAFGLFRRARVLEIGGYMTGRGEFHRDTVGEDMGLVVRLVRRMRENKRKYRIRYAASANCWTEVPEDLNSLYKQRDRWHRGLVEIMTYHRKMLFNPKYGSAGMIAFPYFVIFEFIGPFYEFAGYPLMIIGFATGALHAGIFLVMFSAILLFGLLISMISLILSEKDIVYFRRRELAVLIFCSVVESFGFRQIMGWVRVFSFVGMLFKTKGWQKFERKGFITRKPAS